jgi:hypothetical protein
VSWGLVHPEHADLNVILWLVSFDMVTKDDREVIVNSGEAQVRFIAIIIGGECLLERALLESNYARTDTDHAPTDNVSVVVS